MPLARYPLVNGDHPDERDRDGKAGLLAPDVGAVGNHWKILGGVELVNYRSAGAGNRRRRRGRRSRTLATCREPPFAIADVGSRLAVNRVVCGKTPDRNA